MPKLGQINPSQKPPGSLIDWLFVNFKNLDCGCVVDISVSWESPGRKQGACQCASGT